MFEKKEDKKKAKEEKALEADKAKSKEDKALEAEAARAQDSGVGKNQIERSFGDDQNHRYDPEDLKAAKGLQPSQEIKLEQGHDVHVNVDQDLNKDLVKKDYSSEIKVGDLVYLKPKEKHNSAAASPIDGRPWTVQGLNEGKASCLIMDPSVNLQKSEVFDLKDLMKDPPK